MNKPKFELTFEPDVKVAAPNKGWMWMQINTASLTLDSGEEFQVQFGERIQVMNKEGKIVASVSVVPLLEQLAEIVKSTKRGT